jgi:catechol 2,3-dioxygenase-like lactoylglutathione lyase family enzyme
MTAAHAAFAYSLSMIFGAHVIIFSKDADADRAFFRDVLGYSSADAGHGWLIFALPPAELAVHPSDENDVHEFYFMCDDVRAFIADMAKKSVVCSAIEEQRWGSITRVTLPGGGKIGVYQPRHPSPLKPSVKS